MSDRYASLQANLRQWADQDLEQHAPSPVSQVMREKTCGYIAARVIGELNAERDQLLAALTTVVTELREDRPYGSYGGNAPGHSHMKPGIWDSDNPPGIRGTQCKWCAAWAAAEHLAGDKTE